MPASVVARSLVQPSTRPVIWPLTVQSQQNQRLLNMPRLFWYGFCTIATLLGLLQVGRALIENSTRLMLLNGQQAVIEHYYQQTRQHHQQLQHQLQQAESVDGLEAMARNQLEWVGDREILVHVN